MTERNASWPALLVVLLGALTACPPRGQGAAGDATPARCERLGQNCEVAPGKLGTCVVKDGCTDGRSACFACQSQH